MSITGVVCTDYVCEIILGELPSENLVDIIKSRTMALRFLNSCFCWMVVTMVYYGLSLNATNLAGNPYTNFILVSLVEIPGKTKDFLTFPACF